MRRAVCRPLSGATLQNRLNAVALHVGFDGDRTLRYWSLSRLGSSEPLLEPWLSSHRPKG